MKNQQLSPSVAKFSFSKNRRDLIYKYFFAESFLVHQRTIAKKKILN